MRPRVDVPADRMLHPLSFAALALLTIAAQAQAPSTLAPVRASEHVYYFQGESGMATAANRAFTSNASFVVTKDGVVVFDALGTPALGAAMKAAIARVTPQPIRLVILSHFHADHFYGLQELVGSGVEVWGHANGRETLGSPFTQDRLQQRQRDLAPDVGPDMRLVSADRWLEFDAGREIAFERGGIRFRIIDVSGAHSPEDLMLWVDNDRVLLAGDLYFSGRIPFVGDADTKAWLAAMDRIGPLKPAMVVPGHGKASRNPQPDIDLTREYLQFLRREMGKAVQELVPFDEAYGAVDWSRFAKVPAFEAANRINAYGTYLRMEQEALKLN
jgi:glyoxylase-like metal-dependent hydrolase (beta-lactamase superfamily II)